ncbi:MAG: UDP-N-acetylmuramoyl-tripeptide--D-alanyl-D-alanine ligase [Anaerolineales bacterium]|nr:UDP-N-acetylmuramoyl-tripeptide--D-alanyl-D-alanine ligase [Anaerolineales bacterium]
MLTLGVIWDAMTDAGAGAHDALPLSRRVITDAVIDSRQAIPGCLFIALPGEKVDGHDYVGDAFRRGAAFALVEKDMPGFATVDLRSGRIDPAVLPAADPKTPLQLCLRVKDSLKALQRTAAAWRLRLPEVRVIGITGSVGKSTTKELTASVLAARYSTLANESNLNNEIGLPLTMLKATESHRRLVLEMGFYVEGDIAFLCEIARPQVGVITMIAPVHLERAGSLEAIVDGKAELVEALPADGTAILNYDDERVRAMAPRTKARIFTYGLSPEADLWSDRIEGLGLEGVSFDLHYEGETLHVRLPLLGQHSVHTAMRASAVGLTEGLNWQEILGGLLTPSTQLRLVAVTGPGDSLLIDDTYNASPDSMIAALNLLAELDGRKVAVLGDMLELGEFEETGHRMVGARSADVADLLLAVGPKARWIADEAHLQGLSSAKIALFETAKEACEFLRRSIGAGDVVLVKGSRALKLDDIVLSLEVPE